MTLQTMYVIVHLENHIRVFLQKIFSIIHEMYKAQEMEPSIFAVRSDTASHIVNIAIQFWYENINVLATVKFWKI